MGLVAIGIATWLCICFTVGIVLWVLPNMAYRKHRRVSGFGGPKPSFPWGNIGDMIHIGKKDMIRDDSCCDDDHHHHNNIHSKLFPFFARWQKEHGKVFTYWLGTEPFLYIADPEFLKKMSGSVVAKNWGKPGVFKHDRDPMFGAGLLMVEGDDWVRHRHVITPAFSSSNLQNMANLVVESVTTMLDKWTTLIKSREPEIDFEKEIINTAGEIIAKTSFGLSYGMNGRQVFEKLRALQVILFKSNRFVGVPFSKYMYPKKTLKAKRLGKEIDSLILSIIKDRMKSKTGVPQKDLLALLMEESREDGSTVKRSLTTSELVDECKTFFFGGHETTALALTWTMLLLAIRPEWQNELRAEIKEVFGDGEVDATKLGKLTKMGWVMNEVLRLYPPAPNAQRQARQDIRVEDKVIPNGTNIWIDLVSMHHDRALWGDDVNEFKPERFKDDPNGGCRHKMGYVPFGFGGRMCVGRNLSFMEYKIVLTLILTKFSFSLSPNYRHSPAILLSLRPTHGLPLIFQPL